MKTILKLEELLMFVLGILAFKQLPYEWWLFPALLLVPDIGMLGYLAGNKSGAFFYNVFHHRGIAVITYCLGVYFANTNIQLIAIILFSHIALDRIFGYGLKYETGFKFTHLGEIGK